MAFWPAAVAILFYSMHPSMLNLIILVGLLFTSSMMYLALRQLKKAFESLMGKSRKRKTVGRKSKNLPTRKILNDVMDLMDQVFPNKTVSWWIVSLSFLVNTVVGLVFLYVLINRIIMVPDPSLPVVGLAALPVLYAFTVVSTLIWNM